MSSVQAKTKPPARRPAPARTSGRFSLLAGGAHAPEGEMAGPAPLSAFYLSGPAVTLASQADASSAANGGNDTSGTPHGLQFKLAVGRPGDHFENEADSSADRVASGQAAPAITPLGHTSIERMPALQAQDTMEDEEECAEGRCFPGASTSAEPDEAVQLCKNCGQEKEEGPPDVQAAAQEGSGAPAGETAPSSTGGGSDGNAAVSHAINHPGPGAPLSPAVQGTIEAGLGTDLNGVRVHHDSASHRLARSLHARAFTHGQDIWLGSGESPADTRLMAHEATHVVQQRHAGSTPAIQRRGNLVVAEAEQDQEEEQNALLIQPKLQASATRELEPAPPVGAAPDSGEQAVAVAVPPKAEPEPKAPDSSEEAEETDEGVAEEDSNTTAHSARREAEPPSGQESSAPARPEASTSPARRSGNESPRENATIQRQPSSTGAAGGSANGGGGGTATSRSGGTCAGGGVPTCYTGERERPAQEPEDVPANPPSTEVQGRSDDSGEQDAPEPDNCPPPQAQTAAAVAASPGPAPGAAGGAAAGASPTAPPAAVPSGGGTSAPGVARSGASSGGAVVAPAAGGAGPEAGATNELAAGGAGRGPVEPMAGAGGSPMDATINLAEAGRDTAVSAYENSSSDLATASQATASLRRGTRFAPNAGESNPELRRQASARADQFFAGVADRLDVAIERASGPIPDQLGRDAETAKTRLAASTRAQKQSVLQRIEGAKRQARADARTAQRLVNRQTDAFGGAIKEKTAKAIQSLTSTRDGAVKQVNDLETKTLDHVNEIYSKGRTALEGLGTKVGAECVATGAAFAAKYNTFKGCTEDAWYDGNLSERRAEAQAKAAVSVAGSYRDRIVDAARKRAREISKQGRKEDRCAVIASANQAREALAKQFNDLKTALESSRDAAIQQAHSTRDGLITSIKLSLVQHERQLDRQKGEQLQTAEDTRYMQQLVQELTSHAAAAAVQQGVTSAVSATRSAVSTLQDQLAANRAPDPATLDTALSVVERRIGAALEGLDNSAEGGASAAGEQLRDAGQQGMAALEGVTQSNDNLATTVSDNFSSSMQTMGSTDHFAQQRAGFTQQVDKSTSDGAAALNKAVDGMRTGCSTTTTEAQKKLTGASKELEKNLRQSKEGLECEITRQADEAASKEAPAWKKVIAVVLVIIVIIIVVAVTIATAGGALAGMGFLATVAVGAAIGAAVGAVTSGLLAIAGNLWSNQDWTKGVGKAILVGAITGAIGGAIGAGVGFGVGLAVKGASAALQVAAQFGAAMVTGGGLDVVTQYVMDGFSFDNFSWTNLGMTLVITAITFGIGLKAGARARAGADAPETTTTTPESTTAVPEPTPSVPEPTPTVPEPTPTVPEPTPTVPEPTPTVPEPTPTGPVRRGTVSAGPEGLVEHPLPTPEVVSAPRKAGAPPVKEPPPASDLPPRPAGRGRRGTTSEEIQEVFGEDTGTTPEAKQAEQIVHADDVREQMNPRTSKSTTRAEREKGAIRGERERAARRGPQEEEPGQVVPDERPPDGLFEDPNVPTPRAGEPLERPALREGTKDAIEGNARRNKQGQFVDENDNVIQDPHYGHIAGHENRRIIAAGEELGLTQAQLNEYVNARPEFFQIEEGPINISHKDELKGLEPYDHIVLDMIEFFNL